MQNPERLHEHPFFAHFSAAHLHKLSECLTTLEFSAGATLFCEEDPTTDFYLVETGRLALRKITCFGEFELQQYGDDDTLGATAFVDRQPRSADAEAREDTEVVVFNSVALAAAADQDQQFELALYWSLWSCLSRELRAANGRLSQFFATESALASSGQTAGVEAAGSETVDLSRKLGLFREQKLSPMEINFLASLSREERYEPGQVIFREGDAGDKMYVVAEGRVMISKTISGVGEEALAFLERGDYFGEMALIDKRRRSADASAHPHDGAVVLALPSNVVEGLLDIGKVSSIRLLKLLCRLSAKRVREIHEKLIGWFILAGGDLEGARDAQSPAI